jgi:hypothetical protein
VTAWIVIQRISNGTLPWVALLQLTACSDQLEDFYYFVSLQENAKVCWPGFTPCASVGQPKPDLSGIWNSTGVLKLRVLYSILNGGPIGISSGWHKRIDHLKFQN